MIACKTFLNENIYFFRSSFHLYGGDPPPAGVSVNSSPSVCQDVPWLDPVGSAQRIAIIPAPLWTDGTAALGRIALSRVLFEDDVVVVGDSILVFHRHQAVPENSFRTAYELPCSLVSMGYRDVLNEAFDR